MSRSGFPPACHYPFRTTCEYKVSRLKKGVVKDPARFLYVKQDKAGAKRIQGSIDTVIIPQLCRHAQTLPVKLKPDTRNLITFMQNSYQES